MPRLTEVVGKRIGPLVREYTPKDAALYAVSVGAGPSEPAWATEEGGQVLPTFAMATVFDFFWEVAGAASLTPAGVLHGEQDLTFHRPLPVEGRLSAEGRITAVHDLGPGKGAVVRAEMTGRDADNRRLFTGQCAIVGRLDGGFGGSPPPKTASPIPEHAPDSVVTDRPAVNQPLIYRLTGDRFPLHSDPDFARQAGFERPIMHGMGTLGFACRALIREMSPKEPRAGWVRRLACRFRRPLYPGRPIETRIWRTGEASAVWQTAAADNGEVVIDHGIIEMGPPPDDRAGIVEPATAGAAPIRLDGRVAVITGAGGGLGRVYALALARRGAKVLVNDLGAARDGSGEGSAAPADQVVAEIREAGGEAVANADSVATPDGGTAIVQAAIDAFGRIDILIHNAGILRDKTLAKMDPEAWKAVLDVHLNGAFHVAAPALRAMTAQGYGRIILTTSAAGLYGHFGQGNYAAAKMGLVGLMNTLKLEGARGGVLVNAVAPMAASRMTEDVMPPELLARMDPEMVAPLVVYLSSEACADSGRIINAGMGHFNRAAVVTGPGLSISDGPITPEAIRDGWTRITSLDGATEYEDAGAAVMAFLASAPPDGEGSEEALGIDGLAPSAVAEIFDRMPQAFRADRAAGIEATFQYRITGDAGGDWYVTVREGTCEVTPGRIESPVCTLTLSDRDFVELMAGRLDPVTAFTTGALKVSGDLNMAGLIPRLFEAGED